MRLHRGVEDSAPATRNARWAVVTLFGTSENESGRGEEVNPSTPDRSSPFPQPLHPCHFQQGYLASLATSMIAWRFRSLTSLRISFRNTSPVSFSLIAFCV